MLDDNASDDNIAAGDNACDDNVLDVDVLDNALVRLMPIIVGVERGSIH